MPCLKVVRNRAIDRTRHMACHRVDGLHLATEAFGGTRIEQPARVLVQPLRDLIGADDVARLEARRVGRHRRWPRTRAGLFATDGPPGGQAALEHRRRNRRCGNAVTRAAGVLRANVAMHEELRRRYVELLADVFADLDQLAAALAAGAGLGFVAVFDALQMRGQRRASGARPPGRQRERGYGGVWPRARVRSRR